MPRRLLPALAILLVLVACGRGQTSVDPGPGQPDEVITSTTTAAPDPDSADGELETDDVATTVAPSTTDAPADDEAETATATTILVDPDSANAEAYLELGASGLVLTLDEQACADETADTAIDDGADRLDALIEGVTSCTEPATVDAFASQLISAGGADLPPNEAACVAGTLRSDDEYRPFWAALFDEEPFDFLAVETDVQNLYLDLYAGCVSVGRALSTQVAGELSVPTIDCIDQLYADREFVRVTIEADLSGDPEEVARIDQQIRTCLSSDERDRLGG